MLDVHKTYLDMRFSVVKWGRAICSMYGWMSKSQCVNRRNAYLFAIDRYGVGLVLNLSNC